MIGVEMGVLDLAPAQWKPVDSFTAGEDKAIGAALLSLYRTTYTARLPMRMHTPST